MADEAEESLGSGLEKQMTKFEDAQRMFRDMYDEMSRLKTQCEKLKAERQTLVVDCAERAATRAELQKSLDNLRAAIDTIRIEYRQALDANQWWQQYDQMSSMEFDGQGKLNRRLWLMEQRNAELVRQVGEQKTSHDEEMQVEMATASGLRDRIGKLEEKLRIGKQDIVDAQVRERDARSDLVASRSQHEAEVKHLRTESADMKEASGKEKGDCLRLKEEMRVLAEERQAALDQLKRASDVKQSIHPSPFGVLQARSPNINQSRMRSGSPVTPTKAKVFSASRTAHESPSRVRCLRSSSVLSPTTSLAQRYAHLEDSHKALKLEYDLLRVKYMADLKHWKEWKAVEVARTEMKKRRKDERRAARAAVCGGTARASPPLSVKLVSASEESQPNEASVSQVAAEQRATSATIEGPDPHSDVERDFDLDEDEPGTALVAVPLGSRLYDPTQHSEHTSLFEPAQTPRRSQRTASQGRQSRKSPCAADKTPRAAELHAPLAKIGQETGSTHTTRTTPWLGGSATSPYKAGHGPRSSKNKGPLEDDDVFDRRTQIPVPESAKTPLIRDRLGPTTSTSSLRRTALLKTTRDDHDLREHASPTPSTTPAPKKRKPNLENMSPAEKSMRLKELSKMSAAEKREYYAEYKGKGRYLPPEDVRPPVFEEYEIDPGQNEGANFQFHDVKRRKTERKQMHGGDCGCCKGYYESVGPLPKYNEGPAWKDASQGPEPLSGDFVQEHQDKVSRHRETWRKPPTPPGFWQIGFPTTQHVAQQNATADRMTAEREAQVRREATLKDSKWKKKQLAPNLY